MRTYDIRKARPRDIEQLVELWDEFMELHDKCMIKKNPLIKKYLRLRKDAKSIFRRWIIGIMRSKDSLVLVAEEQGILAGYCVIVIRKDFPRYTIGTFGHISDLYVKKEHRGKRISSRFKDEAFKWMREKGLKAASLFVFNDNDYVRKIYDGWGFKDYTTEMRKPL
jgi:ribosomal protein S18 acetylase RimI-like enzyme